MKSIKRYTHQRDAIRKVLFNAGRPLAIQEIFKLAQNEVPHLGIATVYRNLKALRDEGLIVQVDLPGQISRWEATPEGHHHHFLCRSCDKLYEINDCPEHLERLLPKGYTLEEHDILLRGQCDSCAHNKPRIKLQSRSE